MCPDLGFMGYDYHINRREDGFNSIYMNKNITVLLYPH